MGITFQGDFWTDFQSKPRPLAAGRGPPAPSGRACASDPWPWKWLCFWRQPEGLEKDHMPFHASRPHCERRWQSDQVGFLSGKLHQLHFGKWGNSLWLGFTFLRAWWGAGYPCSTEAATWDCPPISSGSWAKRAVPAAGLTDWLICWAGKVHKLIHLRWGNGFSWKATQGKILPFSVRLSELSANHWRMKLSLTPQHVLRRVGQPAHMERV